MEKNMNSAEAVAEASPDAVRRKALPNAPGLLSP